MDSADQRGGDAWLDRFGLGVTAFFVVAIGVMIVLLASCDLASPMPDPRDGPTLPPLVTTTTTVRGVRSPV